MVIATPVVAKNVGSQARYVKCIIADIANYVGKEVILVGGAENEGAMVRSGGATFKLTVDEMDRETLRYLLGNCSGLLGGQACVVSLRVIPTGRKTIFGNMPILAAAKLVK